MIIDYNQIDKNPKEHEKAYLDEHFKRKAGENKFQPSKEEIRQILQECYDDIISLINDFLDMEPKYMQLIAIWILGTYFHESLESYPYLFINATKGSGKSRLLKLIAELAKDGKHTNNLTESVLFRTKGTLCLDEFEQAHEKQMQSLRELLNSAYKKGVTVARMKKQKSIAGEEQVVEEFSIYRPVVLANINGVDNVLSDRCISMTLDKSDDPVKVRLMETFKADFRVKMVKWKMGMIQDWCSSAVSYAPWNTYILGRASGRNTNYTTTLHTYTTLTTTQHITIPERFTPEPVEEPLSEKTLQLFNKIYETDLKGRNLELFMPLFFICNEIGDFMLLDQFFKTAKSIVQIKEENEDVENMDYMVLKFISEQFQARDWLKVKDLVQQFRLQNDVNDEWVNVKWMGRALKRMNLISSKRRLSQGIEIIPDIKKAKEKLNVYHTKEEKCQ